jgi:diguanylate cyclase (GGDEF)-like protein
LEGQEEHLERWLGIYNRSGFLALGDVVFKQAARDKVCISILLIDIDNFTGLSKKYGHWAGESILKQVTEIIQSNVRRPLDIIGRYRHNVYCILIYSADARSSLGIAEKIHSEVSVKKFKHKEFVTEISTTVSIGIAVEKTPNITSSLENLISRAKDNLSTAKDKGRNCIYFDESESDL